MSAMYRSVNQTDTPAVTFTHEEQARTSRCKKNIRSCILFFVVVVLAGSLISYYVVSRYSIKPNRDVEQDYAKLSFEISARNKSFCKITRQMDKNEELYWDITSYAFKNSEECIVHGPSIDITGSICITYLYKSKNTKFKILATNQKYQYYSDYKFFFDKQWNTRTINFDYNYAEPWKISFNVFTPFQRKVLEGNLKIKRLLIRNSMCKKGILKKAKKIDQLSCEFIDGLCGYSIMKVTSGRKGTIVISPLYQFEKGSACIQLNFKQNAKYPIAECNVFLNQFFVKYTNKFVKVSRITCQTMVKYSNLDIPVNSKQFKIEMSAENIEINRIKIYSQSCNQLKNENSPIENFTSLFGKFNMVIIERNSEYIFNPIYNVKFEINYCKNGNSLKEASFDCNFQKDICDYRILKTTSNFYFKWQMQGERDFSLVLEKTKYETNGVAILISPIIEGKTPKHLRLEMSNNNGMKTVNLMERQKEKYFTHTRKIRKNFFCNQTIFLELSQQVNQFKLEMKSSDFEVGDDAVRLFSISNGDYYKNSLLLSCNFLYKPCQTKFSLDKQTFTQCGGNWKWQTFTDANPNQKSILPHLFIPKISGKRVICLEFDYKDPNEIPNVDSSITISQIGWKENPSFVKHVASIEYKFTNRTQIEFYSYSSPKTIEIIFKQFNYENVKLYYVDILDGYCRNPLFPRYDKKMERLTCNFNNGLCGYEILNTINSTFELRFIKEIKRQNYYLSIFFSKYHTIKHGVSTILSPKIQEFSSNKCFIIKLKSNRDFSIDKLAVYVKNRYENTFKKIQNGIEYGQVNISKTVEQVFLKGMRENGPFFLVFYPKTNPTFNRPA
ncbi:DgyrCDS14585 [Dimorphilus gyrociliatus]|uniref:DgyrCDS14585 n=1 Tax=Dimorphilus gyrociliatus TaxID=2664684 RepID=A0A7I8WE19_9ANNE|nr:DgyrCDS14585 [Dimorphilus gyrociliatus]